MAVSPCLCQYAGVCASMCLCVSICVNVCLYQCGCVCIYLSVCIFVPVCVNVRLCLSELIARCQKLRQRGGGQCVIQSGGKLGNFPTALFFSHKIVISDYSTF